MFKTTRVRSLDHAFRDALIEDCVRYHKPKINLFDLIPKHPAGRLHTLAVLRKMAGQVAKAYPGGFLFDGKAHVVLTAEFMLFAKTNIGMDNTAEEAAKAWQALKGIV